MLDNDTPSKAVDESDSEPGGPRFDSITPIEFEPSSAPSARVLGGQRWLTLGLVFLVLLLFAFAVYVFSGRSVLIDFDPVADEMTLEGSLLEVQFGERWLLQPGTYTVRARKAGYHDFQVEMVVEDLPEQEFLFHLRKLPGIVNVTTEPPVDARLFVDGQPVANTPISQYAMEPGDYRLSIRAERYELWEAPLSVEGRQVEQTLNAELQPAWAEVYLASTPAGATLYVDGEPVGETPLTAEIMGGPRELQLRLAGHKEWRSDLDVVPRQAVDLGEIRLEKADTIIHVSSAPGGATVTVDGEYRGQTPMQLELAPDQRYRIGFAKSGYRSNQRMLDVVDGDEASLNVRLEPVFGEILVSGSPDDAQVLVEGIPRGTLNDRLRLPAHPHRIEVRKEGYEPFTTTVTPNPDLEQRVEVALSSFAAIREARMPEVLKTSVGYDLKLVKPSGIFRMGSGRREQGRRSNEFMRQVQLQRPYYIGFKEVTNEQFWAFSAEHDSGVVERQTLSLKTQPAVRLTWDQAARFCNWLSEREGLPMAYRQSAEGQMVPVKPMNTGYRLPSEAEWAYATRYGGRSEGRAALRYPWGESMPPRSGSGNYAGTESVALADRSLTAYSDPHPATAPAGEYAPGPLGLYDAGGNVHEWIHDYYVIHTGSLGTIPVDPLGPESGTNHVIRGSSWRSASITELRLAYRDEGLEGADDIGFRVARYAE